MNEMNVFIHEPMNEEETVLLVWELLDVREDGTLVVARPVLIRQTHVPLRVPCVIQFPRSHRSPRHANLQHTQPVMDNNIYASSDSHLHPTGLFSVQLPKPSI